MTAGIAPFAVTDEHYRDLALHPEAIILAQGRMGEGVDHPVGWARDGGRSGIVPVWGQFARATDPPEIRRKPI
ncbi:hypothetical protein CDZ98_09940 [Mameliella alba]|nr:hypothetical protein CDZ98_09940 [Mameliella alba]